MPVSPGRLMMTNPAATSSPKSKFLIVWIWLMVLGIGFIGMSGLAMFQELYWLWNGESAQATVLRYKRVFEHNVDPQQRERDWDRGPTVRGIDSRISYAVEYQYEDSAENQHSGHDRVHAEPRVSG